MSRVQVWLGALLFLGCGACTAQAPSADAVQREVQEVVRSYVDATNKADVTAMMELKSQSLGASEINDGSITRGWEAIRTSNDAVVGKTPGYKIALGSIDVVPLGRTHALVIAPTTISFTTDQGASNTSGATTYVLEKSSKGWKILHEHMSSQAEEQGD